VKKKGKGLVPAKALIADTLRIKLASIAVHADELLGEDGHEADAQAIRSLLSDPEVSDYLAQLGRLALLPLKRSVNRVKK
jgi:hypothetical protein